VRSVRSSGDQPIVVHDPVGTGPDVLLAHATGFHGLVWRPLATALRPRFRCWSHDFRGHGLSFVAEGHRFSWPLFGEDVMAVVEGAELDRPFGIGHSKGGAALLMAELAHPGTFRALWLFEPIVFPPDGRLPPEGSPMPAAARRRRSAFSSRDDAYANYASKPPLNVLHADALRAYVDHGFVDGLDGQVHLACRPENEAEVFEMSTSHDTWAHLGRVGCPVTVGYGGDGAGPAEIAPGIAERIPGADVEYFPELGHFGPLQGPDRVAERIEAFFAAIT